MNLNIYSVRDSAVEAFMQPFFAQTHGAAIRSLTEVVNEPKHPFNAGSQYYSLYHIGSFDDTTGQIHPLDPPRAQHLVDCIQLVNKA